MNDRIQAYTILCFVVITIMYLCTPSLRKEFRKWQFLLHGRSMLRQSVKTAQNKPISFIYPGNRLHVVKAREQIDEINQADSSNLSLYVAVQEILQTKYTLNGHTLPDSKKGANLVFITLAKALKKCTAHFAPRFQEIVKNEVGAAIASSPREAGFAKIKIVDLAQSIVVSTSIRAFFGGPFDHNEDFKKASMKYVVRGHVVGELLRLVPHFLKSTFWATFGPASACRAIHNQVAAAARAYIEKRNDPDPDENEEPALMSLLAQKSPPDWSLQRFAYEIVSLFYSSSSSSSLVLSYLIQDLARYSTAVEALRNELREFHDTESLLQAIEQLPLLDSFIKESMRVNVVDAGNMKRTQLALPVRLTDRAVNYRRIALKDFTLSGDYVVPKGEMVAIDAEGVSHNPEIYSDPTTFDAFRFLRYLDKERHSTVVTKDWPVWGPQRQACPGRHYAVFVAKVVVSHLVLEYDMKLVPNEPLSTLKARTMATVHPSNRVLIAHRQSKGC